MKTKAIVKVLRIFIIIGSLVCMGKSYLIAQDDPADAGMPPGFMQGEEEAKAPEYAPGEVLVKFKEGAEPEEVLSQAGLETAGIERIHSIRPAIARFKKECELEKDADGWYWFRGKEYKEVDNIEDNEIFQEAYKEMEPIEQSLYRTYKVNLPEGVTVEKAVSELGKDPNVEYAEPNYIMRINMLPNDPYYHSSGSWGQSYDDLWGLKKIQCEQAWDMSQGEGVVVAVIDTGVDYTHPDLAENIWINEVEIPDNGIDDDGNGYIDDVRGWDFAIWDDDGNDNNPMDGYGHGTHVAGTIAAIGNNNTGVIGVAPKAKIMIVKGLNIEGSGYASDLAPAIRYAADNGADILNCSWGSGNTIMTIIWALDYAYYKGTVNIASAGNSAQDGAKSPAKHDKVIAVAATTHRDEKCDFSNYGKEIEVAAPGGGYMDDQGNGKFDKYNILSTMPDIGTLPEERPEAKVADGYWRLAGTSMAAPHVAGVAALMLAKDPSLTNEEVRLILGMSADDLGELGRDIYFGYGRVNAYAACSLAMKMSLRVDSPGDQDFVHGNEEIVGSAFMSEDFGRYELWCVNNETGRFDLIVESGSPVSGGVLGRWDTTVYPDGEYTLMLKLIHINGKSLQHMITVKVDNVNDPPRFTSLRNIGVVIDRLFEIKIEAEDPDDPLTPAGQLFFEARNLPPGAELNANSGIFTWQPTVYDKGIYDDVVFMVKDCRNVTEKPITLSTVYVEEITLTNDLEYGWSPYFNNTMYPSINDNKVVWINMNRHSIHMYDILDGTFYQITETDGVRDGAIVSDYAVAWRDQGPDWKSQDVYNIYMYDLIHGEEKALTDEQSDSCYPRSIYKDKILWSRQAPYYHPDAQDYQYLYMYDCSTGQTIQLAQGWDRLHYADIYEDKVVWAGLQYFDDEAEGVYMLDLSTGENEPVLIAASPDSKKTLVNVNIHGDKMTWETYDLDYDRPVRLMTALYLYDIPTSRQTKIIEQTTATNAHLHDGRIVYWREEGESGRWDGIWMYDSHSDQDIQIVKLGSNDYSFYQNKVVYQEWRSATERGIYLDTIYFYPQIESVDPTEAIMDAPLRITGTNFGYEHRDSSVVLCNGADNAIELPVKAWSDSEIICRLNGVPDNLESGLIKVITPGGESNGINITISNPSILNPVGDKAVNEGELLTFTVSAQAPEGSILAFTAEDLPEAATFEDNGDNTATFSWRPTYEQAGECEVVFAVSDTVLVDLETITITVNNVNRPPAIDFKPLQEVKEGEELELQLDAKDPDGDRLLYTFDSWDISLHGLELSPEGLLTWKPDYLQSGEYTLELIVSDVPSHPDDYIKTYFSISIHVIEVTDPPKMLYLRKLGDKYFMWLGKDKEDGLSVKYSYRVYSHGRLDQEDWSQPPTTKRKIEISEVSKGLKPGTHLFQVKAIDSHGAESGIKSVEFTIALPLIKTLSPREGIPGDYITIIGTGFGRKNDSSQVTFSSDGFGKIEPPYPWPHERPEAQAVSGSAQVSTEGKYLDPLPIERPIIPIIPKIKGVSATIKQWRSNYIKCYVPELEPGTYDVAVTTVVGTSQPQTFIIIANQPPEIIYLYTLGGAGRRHFYWLGRDKEDGFNIKYSYRIDEKKWSKPSRKKHFYIGDKELQKGNHFFEVKAIDEQGLESEIKSIEFKKINK